MRFGRPAKTGYIVMACLFCLLGILMIVLPGLSVSLVGIAAGVMLIVFGVIKLFGLYADDWYRHAFRYDWIMGALQLILGIVVLSNPMRVMGFLGLTLGIVIAADGVFKLQTAFEARRFGVRTWWLILISAIAAVIVGLLSAFHPVQSARLLMILLGISVLAEGVMNLIVGLCAAKISRDSDPIETTFKDNF